MLAAQTVLTAAVLMALWGAFGSIHQRTASPIVADIQRQAGGWYLLTALLVPIAMALGWTTFVPSPRKRLRLVVFLLGLAWTVVLLALAFIVGLLLCNHIPGGSCL